MCIDDEPDTRGPVALGFLPTAYVLVVTVPVILLGLYPQVLAQWTEQAALHLFN